MTDKGEPAFPGICGEYGRGNTTLEYQQGGLVEIVHNQGISMRDYFAAKAMQGMLAYPGDQSSGSWHNNSSASGVAERAYEYADAMLAERSKQ